LLLTVIYLPNLVVCVEELSKKNIYHRDPL